MPEKHGQKPLLLFVVTEDYYFLSHRLTQARAAEAAGFDVCLTARDSGRRAEIEALGYRFAPVDLARGSLNPLHAVRSVLRLRRLIRRVRPDAIHTVAIKGVVFGATAACLAGTQRAVHAVTGLGAAFITDTPKARIIAGTLLWILRFVMRRKGWMMLFQNDDDRALFVGKKVVSLENSLVIRGSGVDTKRFHPSPKARTKKPLRAVFAGRLLHDKGVAHLAEAADLLNEQRVKVEIILCGRTDPANPASLSDGDMEKIAAKPNIQVLGQVSDMTEIWADADMAVLPSRREGLPMTLLEAAACGLPLVSTDVPGCREIVRDNENGILVPWNDPPALANAISRICADNELRAKFGRASRQLVEQQFSSEIIFQETKALYQRLLPPSRA